VVDIFVNEVDALRLNLIQSLVCAVLSALVMAITEEPDLKSIGACWLPLAHTGFLSMGAAYTLQIIGQKHLEPAGASLIMSLESVFAVLCGCWILGETLTIWETTGCVLVFIAVILSQMPDKKVSVST
jgi:drug/metabolite transporter (DMT)-like permease